MEKKLRNRRRYEKRMARLRARSSTDRVRDYGSCDAGSIPAGRAIPLSRTPEEAVISLALYGVAEMKTRELIDAANIRAKRRREALKNSGITSLPVPDPEVIP